MVAASKETGLEKKMLRKLYGHVWRLESRAKSQQNTGNKTFGRVEQFRNLGTTLTN